MNTPRAHSSQSSHRSFIDSCSQPLPWSRPSSMVPTISVPEDPRAKYTPFSQTKGSWALNPSPCKGLCVTPGWRQGPAWKRTNTSNLKVFGIMLITYSFPTLQILHFIARTAPSAPTQLRTPTRSTKETSWTCSTQNIKISAPSLLLGKSCQQNPSNTGRPPRNHHRPLGP